MQQTSELYQVILADAGHRKEYKVVIAGKEYGQDQIVSLETSGGLFEQESVCAGSAVSRQAELVLRPDGAAIPPGAEVRPWYRLTLGDQVSEWVPRGKFYVSTRGEDRSTGVLTLHCFDPLFGAEKPWEPDQALEFPMTMPDAARELARLIGLELDERTVLNPAYTIDYPTTDPDNPDPVNNNYTIRQYLRWIAAAHGGNWTVTEAGKLRLVRLRDLAQETSYLVTERGRAIVFGNVVLLVGPESDGSEGGESDKTFVGRKAADVQASQDLDPISKIVILIDDDNYLEAGDDSGQTLELSCPFGTQQMANNLLAELRGYRYQPLQAQDALIDPAVELGDGVTVAGVYAMLAEMATTFDGLMASDIGAPGQRETETEFGGFVGPMTREMNRKLAQTRSYITKTAEQIRQEVSNEVEGLAASITVQLQSITSQVTGLEGRMTTSEQTAEGFRRDITGLDGRFNTIEETVNAVTYTGPDGKVMISNGSINLTGAITWADLDATAQGQVTAAQNTAASAWTAASGAQSIANSAASAAAAAQGTIDAWTYTGTTYIDGRKLMTDTVMASKLQGGMVTLLTSGGIASGAIYINDASSADYAVQILSAKALRLTAGQGDTYIENGYGTNVHLQGSDVVIGGGNLIPRGGSSCVGSASAKWSAIYASTGEIQTSDASLKHDIGAVPDVYYRVFARIDPQLFKLNDGTSDRYHVGFIAQDVEAAMLAEGLDSKDFGGFVADVDDEGNPVYMLRYTEFMPLILGYARQLEKRIAVLEGQQNG